MHELSVALEVCRLTEEQVGRDGLSNVLEVGMDVGNDAGVEISNLEFCLEALLFLGDVARMIGQYATGHNGVLGVKPYDIHGYFEYVGRMLEYLSLALLSSNAVVALMLLCHFYISVTKNTTPIKLKTCTKITCRFLNHARST